MILKGNTKKIYDYLFESDQEWVDISPIIDSIGDRTVSRDTLKEMMRDDIIAPHPSSLWNDLDNVTRQHDQSIIPTHTLKELNLRFRLKNSQKGQEIYNNYGQHIQDSKIQDSRLLSQSIQHSPSKKATAIITDNGKGDKQSIFNKYILPLIVIIIGLIVEYVFFQGKHLSDLLKWVN